MTVVEKSSFGCLGNTIATADGRYLDLANPNPSTICIDDIAIGLSNCCRFAGQLARGQFYSVAEHCFLASRLALKEGHSAEVSLAVLMHDASEAYMGDCAKPLKNMLPAWREIEDRLQRVIEQKWSIAEAAEVVQHYDRAMLVREKIILFRHDLTEWHGMEEVRPAKTPILGWQPRRARNEFLAQFERLMDLRAGAAQ